MSDNTLSEAIKEAYASSPSDEVILFTIELNHPSFTQPLRVVRDSKKLVAVLEDGQEAEFAPYAFDLKLPEIDEYGKPELTIQIDNVGRELIWYVEQAMKTRKKIDVTYRLYLESDLSCPQNNPPMMMQINTITATQKNITMVAGFAELSAKAFPKKTYTLEQFPSLQAG